MTQSTLFDFRAHELEGMPPSNGVDTSQDAAESIAPSAGAIRARIYQMLLEAPMTCDEIEAITGMRHQTVAARLWELEGNGQQANGEPRPKLIEKSDDRRKTRSGRNARVYRALFAEVRP